MAGKQISAEQLTEAVKAYCISNLKQSSQSEEKPNKITIFDGTPQPGDPMVWLEDGLFRCSDSEFGLRFAEEYLRPAEQPKVAAKMNMPAKPRNGNGGALVKPAMMIRDVQVSELSIDDIKEYICPAASDKEAFMFLRLCQARNLNPFTSEAYLVKYGDKANMIVGKEAFTRKAEENPHFKGIVSGIVLQKNGELVYRTGTICLKGEELVGGWAETYRDDRDHPFRKEAPLSEYDTGKALWATKKATMINKVAEVQSLRAAFPSDLAGCYSSDEMGIDPEKEIAEAA